MVRDRRAALILQAAAKGVVDFSQYKPFDRGWLLRLKWLLQEVHVENIEKFIELQHNQHVAALEYAAGKEVFDHHWKAGTKLLDTLATYYFPWQEAKKEEDVKSLRQLWVDTFGDPANPEVAAKIKQTAEDLKIPAPKPKKESQGKRRSRSPSKR